MNMPPVSRSVGEKWPEVVDWRGMQASTGFKRLLADVLPLGDALANELVKKVDECERLKILLTATQAGYVRDHEELSALKSAASENRTRLDGIEEAAQFLDDTRREMSMPGNLADYGRGVLKDAADSIRRLKETK